MSLNCVHDLGKRGHRDLRLSVQGVGTLTHQGRMSVPVLWHSALRHISSPWAPCEAKCRHKAVPANCLPAQHHPPTRYAGIQTTAKASDEAYASCCGEREQSSAWHLPRPLPRFADALFPSRTGGRYVSLRPDHRARHANSAILANHLLADPGGVTTF